MANAIREMQRFKLLCKRTKCLLPNPSRPILYEKLGYVTEHSCKSKSFNFREYCTKRDTSHHDHLNKLNATASYTLQNRILKYMRRNNRYNTAAPHGATSALICDYNHKHRRNQLIYKTCVESLPQLLLDVSLHLTNLSSREFLSLLQEIDKKCCLELDKMSRVDILRTLDAWMHVLPHRLITLKFYMSVLNVMKLWVCRDQVYLSTEDFLQMLFYVGLLKKSPQTNEIIRCSLDYIDNCLDTQNISVLELSLLASAIFKTSTKIASKQTLALISSTIENQLDVLLLDPALLITLIKPLRHAEFYGPTLLMTMASKITTDPTILDSLNFPAKVHILALYAGAMSSEHEVITNLVNSSLNDLKQSLNISSTTIVNSYLSERPRNKDLSRFLWSISSLNFDIAKSIIEYNIIPHLQVRLQNGEYEKSPEEIIDCLLSLWILGHNPCDLVVEALSLGILTALRKKNKLRFNSRLALLLTCVDIEEPRILHANQKSLKDFISKYSEPNVTRHLEKRPILKKVFMGISILAQNYGFSKITCNFAIPHLHIAGITVDTPSGLLYIEVLDHSVCLHKSERLQGLTQLKLRLLKTFNNHLIVIKGSEIEKFTEPEDLNSYLKTELQKVARIFWAS